ncbi:putative PLC-like phosphodiesterase, TIM beta/alpha-barrel domain-containing protein [Rosa chinensis]|uniref:Putative PLC-like phosphodiesterase, TIM beta/alpha-barrel domain-containing protein n=1 Tax=Rosa chinensis TaxID=74649 RepID=A0A2P6PMG9_ROSCH|nr:putative PLC-like phosphodiesterase, TIM beta/alpha-barrel domain-containing protein [Rosa chinensis]
MVKIGLRTVMNMIKANQVCWFSLIDRKRRLLIEGIAYQWNYMVENQCKSTIPFSFSFLLPRSKCTTFIDGDNGMKAGTCGNRGESSLMMNKTKSIILMNYFSSNPNIIRSCNDNPDPLLDMIKTCQVATANQWPNFVAADFYTENATYINATI